MKKLFITTGTLATAVIPVATVISCGNVSTTNTNEIPTLDIKNQNSSKSFVWLRDTLRSEQVNAQITEEELGIKLPALAPGVTRVINVDKIFDTSKGNINVEIKEFKDHKEIGSANVVISQYADPSVQEMMTIGTKKLASIVGGTYIDKDQSPSLNDRKDLKDSIKNDHEAASLLNAASEGYDTKAKWDNFIDNKIATIKVIEQIIKDNGGKVHSAISSFPNLFLWENNASFPELTEATYPTKTLLINKVKTVIGSDQNMIKLYTDFINAQQYAKESFYLLKYINAIINPSTIFRSAIFLPDGIKTDSLAYLEKVKVLRKHIFDSKLEFTITAQNIIDVFENKNPFFAGYKINIFAKLNGKMLTKSTQWENGIKWMGGEVVVQNILSKLGYTIA